MADAQLLEDLFMPDQSSGMDDLETLQMLTQGGGYGSQGMPGSPVMLGNPPPQLPWQNQQPAQDMGGDVKGLSARIQEVLGAKKPTGSDSIMDILSSRFNDTSGTSFGDYAQGAWKSAMGTPTLGGEIGMSRTNDMLKQMTALQAIETGAARADLYRKGGTGTNGATMQIIQGLMASNPGMTFDQALYRYQTGNRQGTNLTSSGIETMPGAPQAAGAMQYGKQVGSEQAELQYAAPIEAARIVGKGEITPVAAKATGQKNMATILSEFENKVTALDKIGGLVNPKNGVLKNVAAFGKSTAPGQFVQRAMGTQEQSLRNDIASMEPMVINAIRQATGMGAKAMDSNAELAFYRAAVRAGDVQAQKNAIQRLSAMYGPGSNVKIPYEQTQEYEDSVGAQNGAETTPAATNWVIKNGKLVPGQ